ncbi:HDOD domain-containing protein [Herbaspirillum sp. SJZ107]|uniref:HDOD domain-containing protein n=1 Tax=Herbaspirillum sp. SJZ107 TaxID=2572881 RepID=UPI0011513733|nr:HDOD domain-containing protein [Herbaspirillum sp. SJZ107]TQK06745.1 HD-like signal output (HDOD) protein [Herbaspirillum sp. SJZ107]
MDRTDALKSIAAQVARGDLSFPTNVAATLKLQHALNDPDCHIDDAARLVQTEPLLAARTVAIANAAAYNRSGQDVTNVRAAVQRVGFRTLGALAAAVIVRQLASGITDAGLRAKADQLWQHSAHVAALSQVIAKRVSNVDPETAMFAGIVHEVGGFYVLSRAAEFPGLLEGGADDWIEHGEVEIGRGVLLKLGVPAPVMGAIEALWNGMRALPPETLGDTLLLANDLCPVPSPLLERPGAAGLRSAATIDFTVGEGTLVRILEESAEEVRGLSAALS